MPVREGFPIFRLRRALVLYGDFQPKQPQHQPCIAHLSLERLLGSNPSWRAFSGNAFMACSPSWQGVFPFAEKIHRIFPSSWRVVFGGKLWYD